MLEILVYLLIFVIIAAVGWWILSQFPLPEPIGKLVSVIFVVVCAIVLVYLLLSLLGTPAPAFRLR